MADSIAKAWIRLVRLPNALIAGGGVWLGAVCLNPPRPWGLALLGSLSMALLAAGGNAENDVLDLEVDRINRPDRPLPSGALSARAALRGAWTLYGLGMALALVGGPAHGLLALAMALALAAYNRKLKGLPLWGNLCVSALCALAVWFPEFPAEPLHTWPPVLFAFLTTLAREVLKDLEDEPGDRSLGLRTLPIAAGTRIAAAVAFGALAATLILLPLPWLAGKYHWCYLAGCLALVLPALGATLACLRPPAPAWGKAQRRLKLVMLAGMAAIAAGALGP